MHNSGPQFLGDFFPNTTTTSRISFFTVVGLRFPEEAHELGHLPATPQPPSSQSARHKQSAKDDANNCARRETRLPGRSSCCGGDCSSCRLMGASDCRIRGAMRIWVGWLRVIGIGARQNCSIRSACCSYSGTFRGQNARLRCRGRTQTCSSSARSGCLASNFIDNERACSAEEDGRCGSTIA